MKLLALLLLATSLPAQWLHQPDPRLPRLADGTAKLDAPTAKTADGHPDLSGVWFGTPSPAEFPGPGGIEQGFPPKYFVSLAGGLNPGSLPMTRAAAEVFQRRLRSFGTYAAPCEPIGTGARTSYPLPYKIVQMPGLILILYEADTVYRQIFLDGRKLPEDPQPSYLGYSVGRWDGDTLVITTTGLKEGGRLDAMGHPHSARARLTERFRRSNIGSMDVQVTVDDPETYTEAVTYTQPLQLLPDTDVLEYFCQENEKDEAHFRVTP